MTDVKGGGPSRRSVVGGVAALGASAYLRPSKAATPTAGAQVWLYLAKLPPADRHAVAAREAAREGGVVICGAEGIDRVQLMIREFNKKYPNVKADFVRLTQADTLTRVLAEQRTNLVTSDLVISSTTYLDLMKPALAPYQQNSWDDWDKRFLFGSVEAGWTSVVYEVLPMTLAWRTDRRISVQDRPKSLLDVENVKWRGRAGCTTQLEEFINAMNNEYGEAEAARQVDKLAALNNIMVASNAALSDNLGSGVIDLAWNFVAQRAYYLQRKGAPVDWVFMKPEFAQGVGMSPLKGCQHPYAAALFLDFLLDATTLETLDKDEPGSIFGNLKGAYALSLSRFPALTVFGPIPKETFRKLNAEVEDKFVRRGK